MISIAAHGRVAFQPEIKLLANGSVCEIRVLSSRFAHGREVTEAVTFFCYDEMAEDLCSTIVKGQEIEATGTQETTTYKPADGPEKQYVKYRLTWFKGGFKPRSERANADQQRGYSSDGNGPSHGYRGSSQGQRPGNYAQSDRSATPQGSAAPRQRRQAEDHPEPGYDQGGGDEPRFY